MTVESVLAQSQFVIQSGPDLKDILVTYCLPLINIRSNGDENATKEDRRSIGCSSVVYGRFGFVKYVYRSV